MIKKCIKCEVEKNINFFYKAHQNTDGYFNRCKSCCKKENQDRRLSDSYYDKQRKRQKNYRTKNNNENNKKYYKTLKGFVVRIYCGMKNRVSNPTLKRYYGLEILDKKTFYDFSYNDKNLKKLHFVYEQSGWVRKLAPSIDRIDPKRGYILGNIRWVSVSDNVWCYEQVCLAEMLKLPKMLLANLLIARVIRWHC